MRAGLVKVSQIRRAKKYLYTFSLDFGVFNKHIKSFKLSNYSILKPNLCNKFTFKKLYMNPDGFSF